jgi:hypothetical protein
MEAADQSGCCRSRGPGHWSAVSWDSTGRRGGGVVSVYPARRSYFGAQLAGFDGGVTGKKCPCRGLESMRQWRAAAIVYVILGVHPPQAKMGESPRAQGRSRTG